MSIQNRILEYLNIERYHGKSIVTNQEIADKLNLSKSQVVDAKYQLTKKDAIINISIKECSLAKVMSPKQLNGRHCEYLSELRGRPFCTIKKVILPRKDLDWFCGVYQCTELDPEPHIEYRNICEHRSN